MNIIYRVSASDLTHEQASALAIPVGLDEGKRLSSIASTTVSFFGSGQSRESFRGPAPLVTTQPVTTIPAAANPGPYATMEDRLGNIEQSLNLIFELLEE